MNLWIDKQTTPLHDAPDLAPSYEESDIATAGTQTFARLRALASRGYTPDFEKSNDGCLLLLHPRKKFRYREMLLDSSGTAQWLHDEDYTTHFSRWEKKRFDIFLRGVPAPTWWDRTRGYRERILAFVVGAVVCVAIYLLGIAALPFANNFFGWD